MALIVNKHIVLDDDSEIRISNNYTLGEVKITIVSGDDDEASITLTRDQWEELR